MSFLIYHKTLYSYERSCLSLRGDIFQDSELHSYSDWHYKTNIDTRVLQALL